MGDTPDWDAGRARAAALLGEDESPDTIMCRVREIGGTAPRFWLRREGQRAAVEWTKWFTRNLRSQLAPGNKGSTWATGGVEERAQRDLKRLLALVRPGSNKVDT